MPTFERKESGSYGDGFTGTTLATFDSMADEVMDAHDPFPRSLRAIYVTPDEKKLSLGIPLDDTKRGVLSPFFAGNLPDMLDGEERLKPWLTDNLPKDEIWVYANNNFIRSRNAPPGTHRFHLYTLWKWAYSDGSERISFTLRTKEGLGCTWHCPYPEFGVVVGKNLVDGKFDDKFKLPGSHAIQYLELLGLDWDQVGAEIVASKAIWPGHLDLDSGEVEPYFPDSSNLCGRLIELVVKQHPNGLPEVQVKIENHDTFGLGPTRGAQSFVEMTPIIVEREDEGDFDKEAERFLSAWTGLTKVVKDNPEADFCVSGKLTQAGKDVAVLYMKPVVAAYPAVVKVKHPDGSPAITLPPTKNSWDLDGMVSIAMVAEWLLATHAKKKIDLTEFIVEADLLEWVAENMAPASSDLL